MHDFDAWDFLDRVNWLYPNLAKPIEVYILSASKYPADVERAQQYSFVKAFMLKPITKELLQKLIRQKQTSYNPFALLEAYS